MIHSDTPPPTASKNIGFAQFGELSFVIPDENLIRGAGAAGAAALPALAARGQRGGRKMPFCDVG